MEKKNIFENTPWDCGQAPETGMMNWDEAADRLMLSFLPLDDPTLPWGPHRDYLGIALVPCLSPAYFGEPEVITTEKLEELGATEDELFALAKERMPWSYVPKVMGVAEFAENACEEMGSTFGAFLDCLPCCVITNDQCWHGCVSILYDGILEEAEKMVGGAFYLIPHGYDAYLCWPVRHTDGEEGLKRLKDAVKQMPWLDDDGEEIFDVILKYEDGTLSRAA